MGIETALLVGAGATAIGGTLYSGITAKNASEKEADALQKQGTIAYSEALVEAARVKRENNRVTQSQKLAFLKNGVTLEGSPLITIESSIDASKEETEAIKRRGAAQLSLAESKADKTRSAGRAALIGSIFSAGSQAMTLGLKAI